jgi:CMP-N-acetylneuraminic acid synthetase
MKILSIIPARSGSKGIKNKNMTKFLGQPLIKHTIEFSKKLPNTTTFVSTDSLKILRYAQKNNIKFDYLRPKKLSKDNSNIIDAISHALEWFLNKNIYFDYLLLLQPTSPLRDLSEIKKIIRLTKKKKFNSVVTGTEMQEHPYECVVINRKKWKYLYKSKHKNQYLRQHYDKIFYFIDGSFYLVRVNFFLKNKILISKKHTFIYKSQFRKQIDINSYQDLKIAEILTKY